MNTHRMKSRQSLLLFLPLAVLGCGRTPDNTILERLQVAESQFSSATGPTQFELAAQAYHQVAASGFHSGSALYNQGNAYMRANQPGRAIASYRMALRYLPRDSNLIANLESALGRSLDTAEDMTLLDYVFVWQRWLSYREKFQLTSLLLVITLTTFWFSHWHLRSTVLNRSAVMCGFLCLLFVASSAVDWYRYEIQRRGVLVTEVTPRKGNSQNYEPAFTKAIGEGTEFFVLERRGEWLRATFGDNAEGWVPTESAVVY